MRRSDFQMRNTQANTGKHKLDLDISCGHMWKEKWDFRYLSKDYENWPYALTIDFRKDDLSDNYFYSDNTDSETILLEELPDFNTSKYDADFDREETCKPHQCCYRFKTTLQVRIPEDLFRLSPKEFGFYIIEIDAFDSKGKEPISLGMAGDYIQLYFMNEDGFVKFDCGWRKLLKKDNPNQ